MRKILLLAVLIVMAAGAAFVLGSERFAKTPVSILVSPEGRKVAELSKRFMENIQFKDFKSAAQLSAPDQREKADIPALIERLFQVKPEFLDISNIELLDAHIDSTGNRARTKVKSDVKILNTGELRHPEVMLYWKKDGGTWFMDLVTSLQ